MAKRKMAGGCDGRGKDTEMGNWKNTRANVRGLYNDDPRRHPRSGGRISQPHSSTSEVRQELAGLRRTARLSSQGQGRSASRRDSEPATQAATEVPTPGERLIYYKGRRIGKGQLGEVHLVSRARDGLVFAAKTFKPLPKKRKHEEDLPAWLTKIRRKFTLMKENPVKATRRRSSLCSP
ncbi:MAG: hypothetical protein M1817_001382 [Caeruleum heppii]|nr:MAG: hypothetical protein M1817_001382 [Caeruleum heppii]